MTNGIMDKSSPERSPLLFNHSDISRIDLDRSLMIEEVGVSDCKMSLKGRSPWDVSMTFIAPGVAHCRLGNLKVYLPQELGSLLRHL
jgi:hypothetical protein